MMKRVTAVLAALLLFLNCMPALGDTLYLPRVTEEMTDPSYWTGKAEDPDRILADMAKIEALNGAFLAKEECRMIDLEFRNRLAEDALNTIAL